MNPLAKRKMKKVLILLIISFALTVMAYLGMSIYESIRDKIAFGRIFRFDFFLELFFGTAAALTTLYFAIRFAEKGKKAVAAIFATPWLVAGLFMIVYGFHLVFVARSLVWWWLPVYVFAGALGVIVYLYAWFSMKWRNNVLFILALVFTFTAVAAVIGQVVYTIVRLSGRVSLEGLQLPAAAIAALVLLGLAIAFGVKRDDREPKFDNPSMFPELDAYRKSLRKERV